MSQERLQRSSPLSPGRAAVLVVDMQRAFVERGFEFDATGCGPDEGYWDRVEQTVMPQTVRLLEATRHAGIEVMYTVIQSLTKDGRDRSLDHKLSNYHIPKGSPAADVAAPLAPQGDEIVLPKSASGVFNATNIEYLLRNLGIDQLGVVGVNTNQCIESAVRDAADRGFYVTVVEDCCAGSSRQAHEASMATLAGYARIASADELCDELAKTTG